MIMRKFSLMAASAAMVLGPAVVQAQEQAPTVNTGAVSFNAGIDFVTEYWFRGIPQENQGIIAQPYIDVTFGLFGDEDFSLDAYVGTWNSFHWGDGTSSTPNNPPGATGNDDVWYESDLFVGVVLGFDVWSIDLGYTQLYNPSGGSEFAEEIHVKLGYDDSNHWGDNFGGLQPYGKVVFEIDGGTDGFTGASTGGGDKGIYYELGIEPSFSIYDSQDYPLTLSIPVTVGFGDSNYYEYINNSGNLDNDRFGFVQIGAVVSTPLKAIPAEYGAYTLSAGVHYINVGNAGEYDAGGVNSAAATNSGEDDSFFASFGISMSY